MMHSQANRFKIQKHERIKFHNAIVVMFLTIRIHCWKWQWFPCNDCKY